MSFRESVSVYIIDIHLYTDDPIRILVHAYIVNTYTYKFKKNILLLDQSKLKKNQNFDKYVSITNVFLLIYLHINTFFINIDV